MIMRNILDNILEHVSHIPEGVKHLFDGLGIVNLLATIVKILPDATAFLTFVWFAIRIYETKTIQNLLPCKKEKNDES